jgi:DNA polymerase III subunit epsilon
MQRDPLPKDYLWLVRALPEGVFVAFDTETTGLDSETGRVAEIGAVKFTKDCVLAEFGELVDPRMPMPAEASAVNGISDAMLSGKPTASEILPRFLEFVNGSVLIAHNAPFDVGFIDAELRRLGLSRLVNPTVDTRLLARAAFPGRAAYHLQTLAEDFGLPVLEAHRALDDARVCMRLFFLCVQRIESQAAVTRKNG